LVGQALTEWGEFFVTQSDPPIERPVEPPIDFVAPRKHGAVAVIRRHEKWLVIRRSATVRAPRKLCFPGGTIEPGEAEIDAVSRELLEELGIEIKPIECIWRSVTSWGVALTWWSAELAPDVEPIPNLAEVEEVLWLDTSAALEHEDLLESAKEFFEAHLRGEILPAV
jgi:8-oxo-dGTP diphosphatase